MAYAGGYNCGGVGVVKSADGGESWSPANNGIPQAFSSSLALNPYSPSTLYSATETYGLYQSVNAGGSWNPVNGGLTWLGGDSPVIVDPMYPSRLFTASLDPSYSSRHVFSSTDSGGNWTDITADLPAAVVQSTLPPLAINPEIPSVLYAGLTTQAGGVFVQTLTTLPGFPPGQRQALIDLYTSTNGASWTSSTNWNGAAGTECTWYGVTCDGGETTVRQLDLPANNLVGTIPTSLGSLTNLEYLDLHNNQLTGAIPTSLGSLTNLDYLDLDTNQLTGAIPNLGALTTLSVLDLGFNAFDRVRSRPGSRR